MADRSGPLSGIKIIELAGIGPAPYTCMMLADAGAQVLRLERAAPGAVERGEEMKAAGAGPYWDLLNRSRPSVGIDLKNPDAVELVLGLVAEADGLIEGFRPGVAERLGVGPEACFARNPPAGLRAHDGLGPGRADGAAWPATTSTTSPSAARCGRWAGPTRPRCRR